LPRRRSRSRERGRRRRRYNPPQRRRSRCRLHHSRNCASARRNSHRSGGPILRGWRNEWPRHPAPRLDRVGALRPKTRPQCAQPLRCAYLQRAPQRRWGRWRCRRRGQRGERAAGEWWHGGEKPRRRRKRRRHGTAPTERDSHKTASFPIHIHSVIAVNPQPPPSYSVPPPAPSSTLHHSPNFAARRADTESA